MKIANHLLRVVGLVVVATTAAQEIDNTPFMDSLTMELYTPDENECTSSLGVSMALSLVYPSAISDSLTEMQTVLGYPEDQSILLWENATATLVDRYQGRCYDEYEGTCFGNEPTLQIANRVFVDDNITLNATYAAIVGDMVEQLDFAAEDAGSLVNEWVNASTNGLIESIVQDGPLTPWVITAINSIYLKASWTNSFDELYTNQDVFYTNTTTGDDAHFMHQVEYFLYSHEALPGFQILQLPFDSGYNAQEGLSMIFVLPIDDDDNATLGASGVDVLEALPNLTDTRVAVALPKFQFESEYKDDLKGALQSLNLTAPFEERLDNLCMVQDRCDAFIDVIIQKTFIDVNEKGVEAAAATAVGISLTSAGPPPVDPILFEANKPFQFFLYESGEHVILFEGQVVAPGIVDGSVVTLTAQHADADFWETNFYVTPIPMEAINTEDVPTVTSKTQQTSPENKDVMEEQQPEASATEEVEGTLESSASERTVVAAAFATVAGVLLIL